MLDSINVGFTRLEYNSDLSLATVCLRCSVRDRCILVAARSPSLQQCLSFANLSLQWTPSTSSKSFACWGLDGWGQWCYLTEHCFGDVVFASIAGVLCIAFFFLGLCFDYK